MTFTRAQGQRDHSWAIEIGGPQIGSGPLSIFDDRTHTHLVHARVKDYGEIGAGYLQKQGERLIEMSDVKVKEEMQENGLGGPTTVTMAPLPLTFYVEPIGHAPLRLVAINGRIARLPRSWARITTNDGRKGVGWLEWNLN